MLAEGRFPSGATLCAYTKRGLVSMPPMPALRLAELGVPWITPVSHQWPCWLCADGFPGRNRSSWGIVMQTILNFTHRAHQCFRGLPWVL